MQQDTGSVGAVSADLFTYTDEISYVFIQNNHATQDLHIDMEGGTCTTSDIKLEAGKAFEHHFKKPLTNKITCIGSGAATTYAYAYE